MNNLKLTTLLSGVALSAFVVGCSDDDDDMNPVTSPDQSNVLIVHASPDAPGVDVIIDNAAQPAVQNLQFPANTGYLSVESGQRSVKVNVTSTSTTVIAADLNLDPNINYTVFAANSVMEIEPLVLVDDLSTPAPGKAHVRFVHLSPDAPPVDITTSSGLVLFGNVAFKGFEGFTPLDAATYDLEVRLAGTSTTVLSLSNIQLEAGKIYTVFARGFVNGAGQQALGAQIIGNK